MYPPASSTDGAVITTDWTQYSLFRVHTCILAPPHYLPQHIRSAYIKLSATPAVPRVNSAAYGSHFYRLVHVCLLYTQLSKCNIRLHAPQILSP
jgi:hypothetical protein